MFLKKILFLVIFNILNFTHSYSNEMPPVINIDLLNEALTGLKASASREIPSTTSAIAGKSDGWKLKQNGVIHSIVDLNSQFFAKTDKINPEVVYFENNKWNFLKKELVDKVNILSEDNSLKFLTFFSLFLFVVQIFAEIELKKDMKPFLYVYRGVFCFVWFFYVTNLLIHKSIKNKHKQDNLLKVMDDFFKNYSTDPNITLEINYRRFVPQELLATFDAIYEIYKNDGTDSLNAFTNIFNDIRNQFLPKKEQYIII